MVAYGTINFTSLKFFRDIVYPIYYFVHGSFDNERTQLESRGVAWEKTSRYASMHPLTSAFSHGGCHYDYRHTSHVRFSYAVRQYTFT
jgi:hypothetical protein